MAEKQKLIPFSPELEKAVEEDAARCRRPFVRQVEAVLLTYYGLENVELDKSSLERTAEVEKKNSGKRSQGKLEPLGELVPDKEDKDQAA